VFIASERLDNKLESVLVDSEGELVFETIGEESFDSGLTETGDGKISGESFDSGLTVTDNGEIRRSFDLSRQ